MQQFSLWATPARRAYLVELFVNPQDWQIDMLTEELLNPVADELIDHWKADDRDNRAFLWKLEKRRLHAQLKIKKRGEFDSIRREQYLADRPIFRIVAIGVGAFTFKRVAQVQIPGLATVWVDISGIPLKVSKNKRHKLARYGRGAVPQDLVEQIYARCRKAVQQYLNR